MPSFSTADYQLIEPLVAIQKVGQRIAFVNAYLHVGDERVVRASGIFAIVPRNQ
jgi:hypothetical protein